MDDPKQQPRRRVESVSANPIGFWLDESSVVFNLLIFESCSDEANLRKE